MKSAYAKDMNRSAPQKIRPDIRAHTLFHPEQECRGERPVLLRQLCSQLLQNNAARIVEPAQK